MKNLYLFLLIVFSTLCTQAQNQPFITTWEVTLSDLSITIPTHPESTYNYTVDFGDGIVLNNQTGDATHMYNTAGTYTVSITGNFPRIYFFYSNQANKRKIKSVGQWGDIQWQNMNYAFYGCENLVINATDAPNLNQVIDLTQMFAKCSNFDQSLNNWDVSTITNMEGMFKEATSFNQPLNNWDVSNVTDMEAMFLEASSFNQDLSNWSFNTNVFFSNMVDNSNLNTTNYENLLNKFYSLNLINKSFSGEGMYYCDGTIRSNLINNRGWTFYNDYQDVCGQALTPGAFVTKWLVGNNVYIYAQSANTDYNYTVNFGDGTVLNNQTSSCSHAYSSPGVYIITITGDYPRIDFGEQDNLLSVEQWGNQQWSDMYNAFKNCSKLKINATDAPDLSQVLSISSMFEGCTSLNQSINHWDVSSVHSMSRMFYGAIKYNQPLNDWDFSSVTNMSRMFYGAIKYNQPLNNWDVSSVTNMESMFQQATSFNQPLNNWDVSNVTDMGFMFWLAEDFNQPVDNWDVSNVTDMDSMFLRTTSFNQPLNLWDVSSVTNMESMFQQATSFDQPLNNWDTSNVADMESMFQQATSFDQPLNNWDVSSVTNMESM
ncbi:surface protein, partial [Mesonia algae]